MKLNCRAGDLALVIHDEPICAKNIGRLVRIKGPLAYNSYYGRPCWLVYPIAPAPYYVLSKYDKEGVDGRRITDQDRIDHPDAWLMPIRPGDERFTSEMLALLLRKAPAANAQEAVAEFMREAEGHKHALAEPLSESPYLWVTAGSHQE